MNTPPVPQDEQEVLRQVARPDADTIFTDRQREGDVRARLAAVVESSDDAIITKTLEGVITTWNKGAQRMFGYTAEEVVGRPVTILMPPDRIDEEPHILQRLKRGERIDHYETVRRHKDGSLLHISLTVSPMQDANGVLIGASKIARDITARVETEKALRENSERLNLAMAAANLGDWDWDAETDIIILSPRGAEIFGISADPPMTRSQMREFVLEEDRNHARVENENACAEHREYDVEYRVRRPDGKIVWVAAKGRGQYDSSGRIVRMLGVVQDITGRKRVEDDRDQLLAAERAARADAERMSILKDEFLATLSHELRTPLNAILGWSQILRSRGQEDEEISEGLAVIERNTKLQAQLIEDLLDMSRITSGKVRLDVQQVDVQDVIKAAVASVRHSADAKSVRLEIVLDPLAGPVRGDPGRLQQCLWNLLSNAIKFTPKGGRVQVALQRVNSHLEVCVLDSGQGIKPEFLPHVFERFRQADSSTTRTHGGLGLGLSIVKHLIELHGGRVRVESAGEGKGATFCIDLPMMAVHPNDFGETREHPRSMLPNKPYVDHPSLDGLTVLVVDDEADARDLLKRLLEDCGAKVLLAASSQQGVDAVIRDRPDVILSDIGMPRQDGYEFIKKVRALGSAAGGRTPAAALTAFARAEDRTRALRAGYQAHIAKPVEAMELTALVESLAMRR